MNFSFRKNRIYLDYASTTPVSKKVQKAMKPFWGTWFHNPNGLYTSSVKSREWLEEVRSDIASFFGAHVDEVVFTSGGTESDNLAILGVLNAFKKEYPDTKPHIVVSAIEHPAVLQTVQMLEQTNQANVSYVGVDEFGVINISELKDALQKNTILVSVMHVNNEIGSIQPIHEVAKTIRHFKKHTLGNHLAMYPLFHTDASQSVLYEDMSIPHLGVDMLTCNAGKIYGPKGVGLLIKKRKVPIQNIVWGGNQEFGIRPGTVALPLVTGLWAAIQELQEIKTYEIERLWLLHDYLVESLRSNLSQIQINGKSEYKVPGVVNVSYPGIESELLLLELDVRGFEVSSKTACKYDDPEESYVLEAMKGSGANEEIGTLRISIGRFTKQKDLKKFTEALVDVVRKYDLFEKSLEKKRKMM